MLESTSGSLQRRTWPPRLYLAIDCGGTKAAAAICDEQGEIIGRGQGGPSNYTDIGLVPFLTSVEDAVKLALEAARLYLAECATRIDWQVAADSDRQHGMADQWTANDSERAGPSTGPCTIRDALAALTPVSLPTDAPPCRFEAAWLGIAGVDSPADVTTLSPHLGTLLSIPVSGSRLIVANDTSLLAAPIADSHRPDIKSGVVAIAGTGSIVMSFKRKRNGMLGVLGRIGGFGWLIGDEGSGYSVGRAAVRRVLDITDRERLATGEWARDSDESDSDDELATDAPSAQKGHRVEAGVEAAIGNLGLGDEGADVRAGNSSAHASRAYGHLLRDRILHHWNLDSTDELLRAVYFDDAHNGHPHGRGVPALVRTPSMTHETNAPEGVGTMRARSDPPPGQRPHRKGGPLHLSLGPPTGSQRRVAELSPTRSSTSPASHTDETSVSPYSAAIHTLDLETRLHSPSPIASLSSSPSRSIAASSDVEGHPHHAPDPSGYTRSSSRGISYRSGLLPALLGDAPSRIDSPSMATDMTSTGSSLSTSDGLCESSNTSNDNSVGGGIDSSTYDRAEKREKGVPLTQTEAIAGSVPRPTTDRKHRLASLAPLVFHLAFHHNDQLALDILRSQAQIIAQQIREIVMDSQGLRTFVRPERSVLCLGGSLVGVKGYRDLLVECLAALDVTFARVEFVGDPARRGALALSHVMERERAAANAIA